MKLIIDLETNGFLDKKDLVIHCIVFKDIETGEVYSYNPNNLNDALELLNKADVLIGHNITNFDIKVLKKVWGYNFNGYCLDTLLCSRLIWTNQTEEDCKRKTFFPPKLIGKHSLESWGYRLGLRKGDFQEHNTFDEWTLDMQDYCERDVEVTFKLYNLIMSQNYSEDAIVLEHKFAYWVQRQEEHGVHFDETSAEKLHSTLTKRKNEIETKLSLVFPAWRKSLGFKRYKRDNIKKGIKANVPVELFKTEIFNPNSRDHIADRLKTLGWKPKNFTATGKPEVNEKILNQLKYPEAKLLSENLMLQKRLGQLIDGEQAYLKLNKQGKIYGKIITNGARTGRCTHHSPNLSQCVGTNSPYGKEFRSLFYSPTNMDFVGIDFSGLELRVLGHYMYLYDNGDFSKALLEDDIHSVNQKILGLSSRAEAKTFIYAFIYGAGNEKLGQILNVPSTKAKEIKNTFLEKLPALNNLINAVKHKVRFKGYVKGIDGRKLLCSGEHLGLNTLIQGAGALLVKQGTIIINEDIHKEGLEWGKDYAMVLHVHDEMQFIVKTHLVPRFKEIAKGIFKKIETHFNFKVQLDGEIKVGKNWSETH